MKLQRGLYLTKDGVRYRVTVIDLEKRQIKVVKFATTKFDPAQPRDDKGQWTTGAGSLTSRVKPGGEELEQVYHGTAEKFARKIAKEGIKVNAQERTFDRASLYRGERGRSVYVTEDLDIAKDYASQAITRGFDRGNPVIFTVQVPKSVMTRDEFEQGYRVFGSIPANWIVGAHRAGFGENGLLEDKWEPIDLAELRKADTWTLYVVMFAGEEEDVEKYNPSQARDQRGRWTTVYHGTAEQFARQIVHEGIKVAGIRNFEPSYYRDERGQSVYVTPNKKEAEKFAVHAVLSDRARGDGIVFKVKAPFSQLKRDELWTGAYRVEGQIPADWIVGARRYGKDSKEWTTIDLDDLRKVDDDDAVTFYVVMFVDPEVEKFDPRQPRDRAGMWTSGGSVLSRASEDRSDWPPHIQKMGVPPAWTDVYHNDDPNGTLQVVGRDAKGRLQYIYSERYARAQAQAKFERVKELRAKFEQVKAENKRNMKSGDPETVEHAQVAGLIMDTGIRPGSTKDTLAATKAFGATTLEGRHVAIDGKSVSLRFTGKAGKDLDIPVNDVALSRILKARAKDAGPDGRLFPNVTQQSLSDYVSDLDGGNFKTKDFRTALGTDVALSAMRRMSRPTNATSYKRAVRDVAKFVSARLGNTPTVALQSYIDPTIFGDWRRGARI